MVVRVWYFTALFAALAAGPAFAQFNKCVGEDGSVVYRDGRCPEKMEGDPKFRADDPVPVPDLSWDRQIFAHWCVERWNEEVSPHSRADIAARLRADAAQGGSRVQDSLGKAGVNLEEAIRRQIKADFLDAFETDCLHFGFRRIEASTDAYNERMATALSLKLDQEYPESRKRFERSRRR